MDERAGDEQGDEDRLDDQGAVEVRLERSAAEPAVELGQPEPREDRDRHRAPPERPPASPERAHRGRASLALELRIAGTPTKTSATVPPTHTEAESTWRTRSTVSIEVRLNAVPRRPVPSRRGRRPALPAGRLEARDSVRDPEGGGSWGKHGSPRPNDHGPPLGTRDRPSDTSSAARLAAAACSLILRDPLVNVQSETQVSDLKSDTGAPPIQPTPQSVSGRRRVPAGAMSSGSSRPRRRGLPRPRTMRSPTFQRLLRYFSFSHSVTWTRYSFHSRRLSST